MYQEELWKYDMKLLGIPYDKDLDELALKDLEINLAR